MSRHSPMPDPAALEDRIMELEEQNASLSDENAELHHYLSMVAPCPCCEMAGVVRSPDPQQPELPLFHS